MPDSNKNRRRLWLSIRDRESCTEKPKRLRPINLDRALLSRERRLNRTLAILKLRFRNLLWRQNSRTNS